MGCWYRCLCAAWALWGDSLKMGHVRSKGSERWEREKTIWSSVFSLRDLSSSWKEWTLKLVHCTTHWDTQLAQSTVANANWHGILSRSQPIFSVFGMFVYIPQVCPHIWRTEYHSSETRREIYCVAIYHYSFFFSFNINNCRLSVELNDCDILRGTFALSLHVKSVVAITLRSFGHVPLCCTVCLTAKSTIHPWGGPSHLDAVLSMLCVSHSVWGVWEKGMSFNIWQYLSSISVLTVWQLWTPVNTLLGLYLVSAPLMWSHMQHTHHGCTACRPSSLGTLNRIHVAEEKIN